MSDTDKLHLPSLSIRAFRGIDTLTISRLGRVTVLAGMNGVGKTTVLDAVRVYAARGRYNVVHELLADRQEVTVTEDEDGDPVREIDWIALVPWKKHRRECQHPHWTSERRRPAPDFASPER